MQEQNPEFEQALRETLSEIISESEVEPELRAAAASGDKITEVRIDPDGGVIIRIGTPDAIRGAGAEPEPEPEARAIRPKGPIRRPCVPEEACVEEIHRSVLSLSFSRKTEERIDLLLSSTTLSRDQLLERLFERAMDALIEQQARSMEEEQKALDAPTPGHETDY